ncbi:MAG TPA: RDD family protein [Steroidobacteraceae bacterium]|nr:RDD family protein [Steroidobacteraceae bacterium]
MKNTLRWLSTWLLLASLCGGIAAAQAHDRDVSADQSDRQIVSIGHNSLLPAGETAQDVVAVMGSTTVDGDATDSAVAVMGNVTVNGSVGNGGAVAVLGNVYINGKVDGDVVAVLGGVKLGPQAVISGQVTEILGTLERSSTAVVQGGTSSVLPVVFGNLQGLHAWVEDCLLYGRPLAPTSAIAWAWWLALAMLAFYLLIAAVFRDGVQRCIQTLETHPGPSILATIVTTILVPVVLLALLVTVIGIAVIPLFWIALICAGIFGRVVALGWLGGRFLRLADTGAASRPVLEVLAGSILVLALYMVPVLGFLVYVLLGVFGFGAVMYALLLAVRPEPATPRAGGPGPQAATPSSPGAPPAGASTLGSADAGGAASMAEPPPSPFQGPAAASPAPAVLDVATLPRAGFWIRMLALLIDLILIAVAMGWLLDHGSGVLLVLAAYGAIMWKFKGTTVGGIVCDLKVVRVDGGPLDWSTAIIRALGCFLSLVVAGLGFIWIAVDREHQAWHDKIAGTVVVRVPKGVGLI